MTPEMSIYESGGLLVYCVCLAAVLGACLGSFLNCAAWRTVRGESFIKGRSRCPACGHALGPAELVPVLSWLLLRGRCRWCGKEVSARYVCTELFFAALTVACLLRFDLTPLCLRNLVFLCCLFCLSLVDFENMTIPDGCLLVSILAWAVALPFLWQGWEDLRNRLLAGALFGGGLLGISMLMDRILKKESLGGGDIKLFAVTGLYLGLLGNLFALILSSFLGMVTALLLRNNRGQFPFGPAIAVSAAILLFCGDSLTAWYLGLM